MMKLDEPLPSFEPGDWVYYNQELYYVKKEDSLMRGVYRLISENYVNRLDDSTSGTKVCAVDLIPDETQHHEHYVGEWLYHLKSGYFFRVEIEHPHYVFPENIGSHGWGFNKSHCVRLTPFDTLTGSELYEKAQTEWLTLVESYDTPQHYALAQLLHFLKKYVARIEYGIYILMKRDPSPAMAKRLLDAMYALINEHKRQWDYFVAKDFYALCDGVTLPKVFEALED